MARRNLASEALEKCKADYIALEKMYVAQAKAGEDAKAEAIQLRAQLDAIAADPEDGKLCARLATILYPDDDPKTITIRDVVMVCEDRAETKAKIAKRYRDTAAQLDGDIDTGLSPEELAEAIFEAASLAARAKAELEELQEAASGAGITTNVRHNRGEDHDLKALIEWFKQGKRTTAEWDRLAELVDLLGLSGNRLAFVLGASDMPSALRAIK
jgi:multidrug efflux pump subunit AcrA (membrane-fusion protein)